jgi:nucleotide-binding universal stress UspA family protein
MQGGREMPKALIPQNARRTGVETPITSPCAPTGPYATVIVPVADTIDRTLAHLACQLADRIGATPELLAVVSPGLEDLDLMQLRNELDALDLTMGVHVVADNGDVAGALLAAAAERRGLLCLGTRGATAVGEALFGSVATEVIRRSRRELLVVGPHCTPDLEGDTLVIAIDGSDGARAIVPAAVDLAGLLDLRPRLVEVLAGGASTASERRAEIARLADVARLAPGTRASDEQMLVHGSRVAETLVDMSVHPGVAMLAMATHAIGRFERLVAGSVTLDVVRRASCPVLVGRRDRS